MNEKMLACFSPYVATESTDPNDISHRSKHTPILKGLLQFAEFGPDRQRLIGTKAPKFQNLAKIAESLYQGGKGPLRV